MDVMASESISTLRAHGANWVPAEGPTHWLVATVWQLARSQHSFPDRYRSLAANWHGMLSQASTASRSNTRSRLKCCTVTPSDLALVTSTKSTSMAVARTASLDATVAAIANRFHYVGILPCSPRI